MEVVEVAISEINIRFRLRTPSEEKVTAIAESIKEVGLLSPITLDGSKNLLAGYHRYLSHKKLGRETIPSVIKESDTRMGELVEISENLFRNELNFLEISSHIIRREELLRDLGLLYRAGDNHHTKEDTKMTAEELASSVGLSLRAYQFRKQLSNIHPEVHDLLVETEWADNLMDLVRLSTENDDIQRKVCDLLITGKCKSWKSAFYEASLSDFKLKSIPRVDFNIKERWGVPCSIMDFKRTKDDLKKICDLVNHDDDLRVVKSSTNFGTAEIKLHQMNPDQSLFSLDYYTNEGDVVCDPFNGRGTTAITSLYLKRKFVGWEINSKSFHKTSEVISKNMDVSDDQWNLYLGCGCEMKEMENESEVFDAVFSSPPYYNKAEPYENSENDPRDLCNLKVKEYDERIDLMFMNLSRLIKRSDYKNRIFKPIIFVLGNSRDGENGILNLEYTFQSIAKKYGLVLWDRLFVKLNTPHLQTSLQRNYELRFVAKNYESQLVWVKF
jgi:ParB family chromosome partitioning protein